MPRVKVKLPKKIDNRYPWINEEMRQLFTDLAEIENSCEFAELLRDLLTDDEMRMIAQRWHIARAVWRTKKTYREMADEIETSITTVARIAHRVKFGGGGFIKILGRVLPRETKRKMPKNRGMVRGSRFAKKMF